MDLVTKSFFWSQFAVEFGYIFCTGFNRHAHNTPTHWLWEAADKAVLILNTKKAALNKKIRYLQPVFRIPDPDPASRVNPDPDPDSRFRLPIIE